MLKNYITLHYHNIIALNKEQIWLPNVKSLWIALKNSQAFAKGKYNFQNIEY